MAEYLALLSGGGQPFIMPEGTSSLGPVHLPLRRSGTRTPAVMAVKESQGRLQNGTRVRVDLTGGSVKILA